MVSGRGKHQTGLSILETSLSPLVDFREIAMLVLLKHRRAPQLISSLLSGVTGSKWAAQKAVQLPGFPKQVCPSSIYAGG